MTETENKLELIERDLWRAFMFFNDEGGLMLGVSVWSRNGYRHWLKFALTDFPNDGISLEDLKSFGIDRFDFSPIP